MFPLAFVAGWLQGHWWGFISRNYVVWPTFLLMNVFIALKGSHFWFLFNQIPYAASNTSLNNPKPTECRPMPFKPWLDKYVRHSVFEFERSALFHARAFAFCLMVPPFEKVTQKKKAENNCLQCCFTLRKCFVFVICRHFTTLKWSKVLKLSKICLKMVKAMTPKSADQNILFLNEWIPCNLH